MLQLQPLILQVILLLLLQGHSVSQAAVTGHTTATTHTVAAGHQATTAPTAAGHAPSSLNPASSIEGEIVNAFSALANNKLFNDAANIILIANAVDDEMNLRKAQNDLKEIKSQQFQAGGNDVIEVVESLELKRKEAEKRLEASLNNCRKSLGIAIVALFSPAVGKVTGLTFTAAKIVHKVVNRIADRLENKDIKSRSYIIYRRSRRS